MGEIILNTSSLIFNVLTLLVLARVILSWIVSFGGGQLRGNSIVIMIYELSEPILRPFQRLIPSTGMIDFTPMVALIVLWIGQQLVAHAIEAIFILPVY
jgi:YggT family protein